MSASHKIVTAKYVELSPVEKVLLDYILEFPAFTLHYDNPLRLHFLRNWALRRDGQAQFVGIEECSQAVQKFHEIGLLKRTFEDIKEVQYKAITREAYRVRLTDPSYVAKWPLVHPGIIALLLLILWWHRSDVVVISALYYASLVLRESHNKPGYWAKVRHRKH